MACQFLEKQGLILVEKNYRCYQGEIDLIMKANKNIVFVEVRSRSRSDYGHPAETVTPAKIKRSSGQAAIIYKKPIYFIVLPAATISSQFI